MLLQWRGSHCTRPWRCALVHCVWLGGHADTQPSAVTGGYEYAVSGHMRRHLSHAGPWECLLDMSQMDTAPAAFTSVIHLAWEAGGLWLRCQQEAVHFRGFPEPAWGWGHIALLSLRSPAQSRETVPLLRAVLWRWTHLTVSLSAAQAFSKATLLNAFFCEILTPFLWEVCFLLERNTTGDARSALQRHWIRGTAADGVYFFLLSKQPQHCIQVVTIPSVLLWSCLSVRWRKKTDDGDRVWMGEAGRRDVKEQTARKSKGWANGTGH